MYKSYLKTSYTNGLRSIKKLMYYIKLEFNMVDYDKTNVNV